MGGPRGPAILSTAGPAADPQEWLPERWLASPAHPDAHRPSGQGGRSKRPATPADDSSPTAAGSAAGPAPAPRRGSADSTVSAPPAAEGRTPPAPPGQRSPT